MSANDKEAPWINKLHIPTRPKLDFKSPKVMERKIFQTILSTIIVGNTVSYML